MSFKEKLIAQIQDAGWQKALKKVFAKSFFTSLCSRLEKAYATDQISPPFDNIFAAFNATPFDSVKVVLMGNSPNNVTGKPHGLSFSSLPGNSPDPLASLIFYELERDILGFQIPNHGYLMEWAQRGVLMLNYILTAGTYKDNSIKFEWMQFTTAVVDILNAKKRDLVFAILDHENHTILEINGNNNQLIIAETPSHFDPKWVNCKLFSNINNKLQSAGKSPINWHLSLDSSKIGNNLNSIAASDRYLDPVIAHLSPRDFNSGNYGINLDDEGNLQYNLLNKRVFRKQLGNNINLLIGYLEKDVKSKAEINLTKTLISFSKLIDSKMITTLVEKDLPKLKKMFEILIDLIAKEERIEIKITILKLLSNLLSHPTLRKNLFETKNNLGYKLYHEMEKQLETKIKSRLESSANIYSFSDYFLIEELLIVFGFILKIQVLVSDYFENYFGLLEQIVDLPSAYEYFNDRIIILAFAGLRSMLFGSDSKVRDSFISNYLLNRNLLVYLSSSNNLNLIETILNCLINISSGSDQQTDHVIKMPRLLELFENFLITINQNSSNKAVDIQIAIFFCLSNFACGTLEQRDIVFYNELFDQKEVDRNALYVNSENGNRKKTLKKYCFLATIGKNFNNYAKSVLLEVIITLTNLVSYSDADQMKLLIKYQPLNIFYCLFYSIKLAEDEAKKSLAEEITANLKKLINVGVPILDSHLDQIADDQNIVGFLDRFTLVLPPAVSFTNNQLIRL